jgi:hypothetical protein
MSRAEAAGRPLNLPLAVCVLGALFFSPACISRAPSLAPPPSRVEAMDGFGSITIRGEGGSSRTRFSFAFSLPSTGRIEALDPLGRAASIFLFRDGDAYMIIPSKKAYWKGPHEDLLERFLGSRLRAEDMAGLLGGQWGSVGSDALRTWALERDASGRVPRGAKNEFRFDVPEFFRSTSVPRTIAFSDSGGSGRVRVLKIRFNRAPRGDAFGLSVLEGLEEKTWPEMEAILNDEN